MIAKYYQTPLKMSQCQLLLSMCMHIKVYTYTEIPALVQLSLAVCVHRGNLVVSCPHTTLMYVIPTKYITHTLNISYTLLIIMWIELCTV